MSKPKHAAAGTDEAAALDELLPAATQAVRNLTLYASPVQIAQTVLDVVARAGYGHTCEAKDRLDAIQTLVHEAAEAEAVFGRSGAGGCVTVERLQAALTKAVTP